MDKKDALLNQMLFKVGDLGLRRRVIKVLEYLDIQKGDRVLDCGCGEGFYTMLINQLYDVHITAFDYDVTSLEKAATWIKDKEKIKFVNGNITSGLPFGDNTFDKIIFSEVLEHLNNDGEALREIYRVVKTKGMVALTVPNVNYPFLWDPLNWTMAHLGLGHFNPRNTILGGVWSYDHKRLYSPETIKRLAEDAGFKVLKIEALTHYCLPFNYHILRLGKLFYTKLPVPKGIKDAMEKFKWSEGNQRQRFSLLKNALRILAWVDTKNDSFNQLDQSSVSLALRLMK